jgi:phospholipid/cholesterol/gamma-HCH transport system substrate-binding protein
VTRRRLPLLLAATALVASTGCDGIFGVDLPGGAAQGPTYEVTVVFDDVLDLVPQSAVKVDDVSVGDVEKITLDPTTFKANVVVRINNAVTLPRNAVAQVRQTSLLGEKFVELSPPLGEAPEGVLADGDVISAERSTRMPEVEEVFTALSALLNGGGIGNLQTIAVELSAALSGREATVRSSLRNITELVTALDQRKQDIVRAIDAMDRLTQTVAKQRKTIAEALDTFTPALTVLADQRAELTRLLVHVARLSKVGTRVINASRADTVRTLELLAPILDKVVSARTDLSKALDQLLLLTKLVPRAIPGDYLQLYVEVFLDPSHLPPGLPAGAATGAAKNAPKKKAPAPAPTPAPPADGGTLDWLIGQGVTS